MKVEVVTNKQLDFALFKGLIGSKYSPRWQIVNILKDFSSGEYVLCAIYNTDTVTTTGRNVKLALENQDRCLNITVANIGSQQRGKFANRKRLAGNIISPLSNTVLKVRSRIVDIRLGIQIRAGDVSRIQLPPSCRVLQLGDAEAGTSNERGEEVECAAEAGQYEAIDGDMSGRCGRDVGAITVADEGNLASTSFSFGVVDEAL